MNLLHKIRVLVAALVAQPSRAKPESDQLDGGVQGTPSESDRDPSALDAVREELTDHERVADLLTRQQVGERERGSDNDQHDG